MVPAKEGGTRGERERDRYGGAGGAAQQGVCTKHGADLDAQGGFHMQMARACWLLMHSRRSPDQPPEEPWSLGRDLNLLGVRIPREHRMEA